jgi:hypothetical protein
MEKLDGGFMNKYLTCLPAVMLLGGIMWMQAKNATQSNLANKDISFAVYKSHSYKSRVYDNTSAEVHIIVEQINKRGQHTIVWEKSINAKSLSKYPTAEDALQQNVIVLELRVFRLREPHIHFAGAAVRPQVIRHKRGGTAVGSRVELFEARSRIVPRSSVAAESSDMEPMLAGICSLPMPPSAPG